MKEYNILIVGVVGQGIIKLAQMISEVTLLEGKNVVMSEIHGMAQRGGSVFSEVRIGEVNGMIIANGECDMLISLEPSEILRYTEKLNKDSIIISTIPIKPFTVSLGASTYPDLDKLIEGLKNSIDKLYFLNLEKDLTKELPLNTIMYGVFSFINPLNFKNENFDKVLLENFKDNFYDINKKAFEFGKKILKNN